MPRLTKSICAGETSNSVDVSFLRVEVMPLVHRFTDAETAHRWGIVLAKYGLTPPFGYNH
uniref:Uncharacterized protein n=1 Tax=Parascaris equorum TaxID=6256 RepID=A0A914R9C6_PAREQ